MTNINRDFIVDYVQGLTADRDISFQAMEAYASENYVPIIETELAQFLSVLVKIKKPRRILEIGTAIGYSSLIMCDALDGNCKITTIEKDSSMAEMARENIIKMGYEDMIEVILGDGEDVIETLTGDYDLIFIDASKGHYKSFFDKSVKLLSEEGIVVSDNVLFKGMIANDELVNKRMKTIVKRLRAYLEYITNLEGYTSSIIPIADGIAITYKEV